MADEKDLVKDVIQVLHDGHKGFSDIGEHLKNPSTKAYFLEESQTRHKFEHELKSAAGITEDVGGTASGAVHRAWGDIKAHLDGGDHALLETAEQGEDAAEKAYKDARAGQLSPAVRDILVSQQAHVVASHDKVKAWRDSKAA